MQLTKKQTVAVNYLADQETREILFGGGAGGAKSYLGCLWLIDRCTKYPGTRWLMGRAKLKTLETTTLNTFFICVRDLGIKNWQFKYNAQKHIIKWWNGSEILLKDLKLYPTDPEFDDLGSLEITGAFIDEANQITVKARNVVRSRIRYLLDENNLTPKLLMTCNPAKNYVYADYYRPFKDGTLPKHRKFIQALLHDNPFISKHYKENLLTLDEVSKQRLLFGNWEYDDDPAKLIDYDAIIDLWKNDYVEKGERYITADIARLGSDKFVVIVWNGLRAEVIQAIEKTRLNEIKDIIQNLQKSYKIPNRNVLVDEDGVGGGIVDFMRVRGFVNNSRPIKAENYQNLKSQCYYKLAEVINKSLLYIKDEKYRDEIIQELEQVKSYKIDSDGKYRILPKEDVKDLIGRSPDLSDALMMRMYFYIMPRKRAASGYL